MSLLAGLDNVFNQASGMSQRQQANKLAERRLLLDEQKQAIALRANSSDTEYKIADANGWLDKSKTRYGENFTKAIEAGNEDALEQLKRITNRAGVVKGGGDVSGFTLTPEGIRATVANPDGTQGAITQGGSNAADAGVEIMSFDDVLENANSLWNLTVNPYQTEVRSSELNRYREVIELESGNLAGITITPELQDDVRRANELEVLSKITDPVARREFIATVNNAGTPEEKDEVFQEAGNDLQAKVLPVPEVKDSSSDNLDSVIGKGKITDARITAYLESDKGKRLFPGATDEKRREHVREKILPKIVKKEREEISKNSPVSAEERAAWRKANPKLFPNAKQKKIDEIIQEEKYRHKRDDKYLDFGTSDKKSTDVQTEAKIKSDSQPVQLEFDQATEKFAGKSTREIADLALSGDITLSPNALQEVAKKLQMEGVKTLNDLKRLDRKDRALSLAAFAATIRPEDAETFYTEARNVMETGIRSMSAKGAQSQDYLTKKLNQEIKEFDMSTVEKALETADELTQAVAAITTAEDYEPSGANSAKILQNGVVNSFWNDLKTYDAKRFPEAHQRLMESMSSVLSQVAAGFAAEEEGGVFETIADLLARDEIDGKNVDVSDMFLNRIIATPDGNIQYISSPTIRDGKYEYEPLDEKFKLSAVRDINSNAARLIQQAARANSAKYKKPAEI